MSSSLLDDLLADLPKQAPGLVSRWHRVGEIAKVELQTCRTCDTQTPILLGLFLIEVSSGITRFSRIDNPQPFAEPTPTEITHKFIPHCAHCLTSLNCHPV